MEPRWSDLPTGWAILEQIPRAVIVTDPDGIVVAWNGAASDLYRWSADDAIGRPIIELLSIHDQVPSDREDLHQVAGGVSRGGDRWVRRRDGERVLVRTATRPVHGEDGSVVAIIGLSEDVTRERLAAAQLRELTDQLRTALDAGGLGTWRWDATTGRTVWDEELERLFGLEPGEFDGEFDSWKALLHPEDRDAVLASIDEALRTGEPYRVEHRIVRPDGEVRWIRGAATVVSDDDGNHVGSIGCAGDVTDEVERVREIQRLHDVALRAAERERLQRRRLEFIGQVNDALRTSRSVQDVMARVTKALVPDLGTWCSLYVLEDGTQGGPSVETWHADPSMVDYARELQSRFPYDETADRGVAAVIRERRTEFIPEIDTTLLDSLELPDELRQVVGELGLSSSIAVPLVKRGRVLGALQLVTAHETRRFTEDDLALAEALANRIASTIDNMRLRDAARETAAILQQGLLPAALPELPGIELATRYWPAGEGAVVGGDFFDVFEVEPHGRWAVVIGDVCGKGPEAASLTGLARHTARAAAWHGDEPVDVLRTVHRALARSGAETYLTAAFGLLDLRDATPRLTMSIGGHPLPLLVRDGEVTPIGAHGTILGLVEDLHLETTTHEMAEGDLLVLYTDGATDIRPPHTVEPEEFEALVAACARDAGGSATAMTDLLGEALHAIQSFDQREDDVAALVLGFGRRSS